MDMMITTTTFYGRNQPDFRSRSMILVLKQLASRLVHPFPFQALALSSRLSNSRSSHTRASFHAPGITIWDM
jgi:hypothetical protein